MSRLEGQAQALAAIVLDDLDNYRGPAKRAQRLAEVLLEFAKIAAESMEAKDTARTENNSFTSSLKPSN